MNVFRVRHLENALNVYERGRGHTTAVDMYLRRYFKSHDTITPKDRAWISEHFYDLVRWRGLLDYVAPPPTTWTNRIRTYFTSDRWRGHAHNSKVPPHVRTSFPEPLFKRFEASLGTKRALSVCNILNEKPMTFLRVNVNEISRDKAFKFLVSKEVEVEKSVNSPVGLVLPTKQRLLDIPEYRHGMFEIQDESSQLVGLKMDVKPGDHVMDFCAGSGGKSLVFGPNLQGFGRIYLHDIRDEMLEQARKRLKRAKLHNVQYLPERHPLKSKLVGRMDWVVCDVPCSMSGSIRRNPNMKWTFSDELLFKWIAQQRDIFEDALKFLKPKGKIVYSTCSILDEENVRQVKYLCHKHGLFLSEPPFHALPQSKGMDGFFTAIMERM
mmetsp:Transcript_23303/g.59853  ORF Transcript_23303/g.59853 Transcript_23303/m.59853 type:complete len:381 (+) Transcript_23303:41-1183(+)